MRPVQMLFWRLSCPGCNSRRPRFPGFPFRRRSASQWPHPCSPAGCRYSEVWLLNSVVKPGILHGFQMVVYNRNGAEAGGWRLGVRHWGCVADPQERRVPRARLVGPLAAGGAASWRVTHRVRVCEVFNRGARSCLISVACGGRSRSGDASEGWFLQYASPWSFGRGRYLCLQEVRGPRARLPRIAGEGGEGSVPPAGGVGWLCMDVSIQKRTAPWGSAGSCCRTSS
jgi:hypothetical protein